MQIPLHVSSAIATDNYLHPIKASYCSWSPSCLSSYGSRCLLTASPLVLLEIENPIVCLAVNLERDRILLLHALFEDLIYFFIKSCRNPLFFLGKWILVGLNDDCLILAHNMLRFDLEDEFLQRYNLLSLSILKDDLKWHYVEEKLCFPVRSPGSIGIRLTSCIYVCRYLGISLTLSSHIIGSSGRSLFHCILTILTL